MRIMICHVGKGKSMRSMKSAFSIVLTTVLATVLVVCAVADSYAFSTFTGSSPYSGVAYKTYYHNRDKFDGDYILNGVDVSAYQNAGKSNWYKARNNGVDFAILRVSFTGYGSSGNKIKDSAFREHYKKAKAAGLMVGVYVFSQACSVSEAEAEAKYAIDRLKALGIGPEDLDLPVYMDYEFAGPSGGSDRGRMYAARAKGNLTRAKATSYADAFCKKIKSYGYEPGIYACTSFLNDTIDGPALGRKYEIWNAQYYKKSEYTGAYRKWQYSSAAKIPGINDENGNKISVDVNYWYSDPAGTKSDSMTCISNASIYGPSRVKYTGYQLKPKYTLKIGDKTLVEGRDYLIGYARHIEKGTGYAYIKGLGSYWGRKMFKFTVGTSTAESVISEGRFQSTVSIVPDIGTKELVDEEGIPLIGLSPDADAAGYKIDGTSLNGVISGSTAAAVKASVVLDESLDGYRLEVVNAENGKTLYNTTAVKTGNILFVKDASGARVASLRIQVSGKATVTPSFTAARYNGTIRRPSVTVRFGDLTVAEQRRTSNDNVDITMPDSKMPGTYTITIKGKGCFAGTYTVTYRICIGSVTMSTLRTSGKGAFTATWKMAEGSAYASGYELQYSRRSDMGNYLIDRITSYKTTSRKVTGRYSGYKYYVRVRAYKVINGKRYYSAWSGKKTIRVT